MTELQEAQPAGTAEPPRRKHRRTRIGVVESDACPKTIRVRVDRLVRHAKYGKYQKRRTVLRAHDEKGEAKRGDIVEIVACRPISKTKSWRLSRIVRSVGGA